MENGEHKKNQHTYVQICPWSLIVSLLYIELKNIVQQLV